MTRSGRYPNATLTAFQRNIVGFLRGRCPELSSMPGWQRRRSRNLWGLQSAPAILRWMERSPRGLLLGLTGCSAISPRRVPESDPVNDRMDRVVLPGPPSRGPQYMASPPGCECPFVHRTVRRAMPRSALAKPRPRCVGGVRRLPSSARSGCECLMNLFGGCTRAAPVLSMKDEPPNRRPGTTSRERTRLSRQADPHPFERESVGVNCRAPRRGRPGGRSGRGRRPRSRG